MQACAETKSAGEAVPCRAPARVPFGLHVCNCGGRAGGWRPTVRRDGSRGRREHGGGTVTQSQTKTPLGICDTVLRDSNQSLLATRMRTEDMIPAMEMLDDVGYWSLEVWGGATFDSCMRFLNEDPWERLRTMRKRMPKTRLQMLLRGQVVVGYRHYADDVVDRFIAKAVENGMQVFRIFDALNDIRNMEPAMRAVRKY